MAEMPTDDDAGAGAARRRAKVAEPKPKAADPPVAVAARRARRRGQRSVGRRQLDFRRRRHSERRWRNIVGRRRHHRRCRHSRRLRRSRLLRRRVRSEDGDTWTNDQTWENSCGDDQLLLARSFVWRRILRRHRLSQHDVSRRRAMGRRRPHGPMAHRLRVREGHLGRDRRLRPPQLVDRRRELARREQRRYPGAPRHHVRRGERAVGLGRRQCLAHVEFRRRKLGHRHTDPKYPDGGSGGFGPITAGDGITVAFSGNVVFVSHNGGISWDSPNVVGASVDSVAWRACSSSPSAMSLLHVDRRRLVGGPHKNGLGGSLACTARSGRGERHAGISLDR